jgi:hypothetical protein
MRRICTLCWLAVLVMPAGGCRRLDKTSAGRAGLQVPAASPGKPAESELPWLNPLAEVRNETRLVMGAREQLDQASFLGSGVLCLMNDPAPSPAKLPRAAWVAYAGPAGPDAPLPEDSDHVAHPINGVYLALNAAAGQSPTTLLAGPRREQAAVLAWTVRLAPKAEQPATDAGSATKPQADAAQTSEDSLPLPSEPAVCLLSAAELEQAAVAKGGRELGSGRSLGGLVPVLFGPDGAIYLRPFGRAQVSDGLVEYALDRQAPAAVWQPGSELAPEQADDPALLTAPSGGQAAGVVAIADSSAGGAAWQIMLWRAGRGLKSRELLQLPAAAGVLPDDNRTLLWADERTLALVRPAVDGVGGTAWTLLSIDTIQPRPVLVSDALVSSSGVLALDGVLFYCTRGEEGMPQLWASSTDGLRKRLLYTAPGATDLRLADAFGKSLLVIRDEATTSSVRCQLIEMSLAQLPDWSFSLAASDAQLDEGQSIDFTGPAAQRPGQSHPNDGFIPDVPGEEGGPANRYKRRDKSGSGGSDGGGGNQQPPDLSLPGI